MTNSSFGEGSRVRSGRIEEEKISAGVRERGTLSSVWFGSCQREKYTRRAQPKHNKLPSALLCETQDYHPRYIHHVKEPFAFCTHAQPYGYTRDGGGVHTDTRVTAAMNFSQEPLIHSVTGNRSKWTCACVRLGVWCLGMSYVAINPPCILIWLLLSSVNAPLRAIMAAEMWH